MTDATATSPILSSPFASTLSPVGVLASEGLTVKVEEHATNPGTVLIKARTSSGPTEEAARIGATYLGISIEGREIKIGNRYAMIEVSFADGQILAADGSPAGEPSAVMINCLGGIGAMKAAAAIKAKRDAAHKLIDTVDMATLDLIAAYLTPAS